jgi:hypothetical protein
VDDPGQQFTPGEDDRQTYAETRRARLHRGRVVGFSLCIALWLLSAVPLARLSSDEGGGAGVAAAYLAAGLGIAVLSRGIYAWRTRRPFWSPWLFLWRQIRVFVSGGPNLQEGKGRPPLSAKGGRLACAE